MSVKGAAYLALNVASGVSIVFLNKIVFTVFRFRFAYALAFIHSLATIAGSCAFATMKLFVVEPVPLSVVLPLAAAFVGYVVCWNLSLKVNPVGFYQLSKIGVTPATMLLEVLASNSYPTVLEVLAVAMLSTGVVLATLTDTKVVGNLFGLLIGVAAVCFTAAYQVWTGRQQKQLNIGSMPLMHAYAPWSSLFLLLATLIAEPLGVSEDSGPDTLLNYPYTPTAIAMILLTAALALLVNVSTFLAIGATSSVTFNVIGHSKLIIILAGSYLIFQEPMPPKRLAGVGLAVSGMGYYSWLRIQKAKQLNTNSSETGRVSVGDPAASEKADVQGRAGGVISGIASAWQSLVGQRLQEQPEVETRPLLETL